MAQINKHKGWGLRIFIYLFIFCVSANAIEYFFLGKNYLAKRSGIVSLYKRYYFERMGTKTRGWFCETIILLEDRNTTFRSVDRISYGTFTDVENNTFIDVKEGDTITIYTRKWYQALYNLAYRSNIYYVKRMNGEVVYDNIAKWKSQAFAFMCVFSILSFIFSAIHLQYVKNLSISEWFEKYMSRRSKPNKS